MASAQNFFQSTPAPDPRSNPIAMGVAGGLQGLSNYGTGQQEQGMAQQDAMQKLMLEYAKQGQFKLGQGGAGTTPETYAGQQGYYNPSGTTPEGALDQEKLDQMVHPDTLKAMGTLLMSGAHDAYKTSNSGLPGTTPMSMEDYSSNLVKAFQIMDKWKRLQESGQPLDGSLDDKSKSYSTVQGPQEGAGQSFLNSIPELGAAGNAENSMIKGGLSAVQKMFAPKNPATGEAIGVTANPRAMKLEGAMKDQAQAQIDRALKEKSHTVVQLKDFATQHGWDPNQFEYGGK